MPARLDPKHDARTRAKIQTSQLVNRLTAFALGGVDPKTKKPIDMTTPQVTAALGVLRKSLPDLQALQLSGDAENPIHVKSINDFYAGIAAATAPADAQSKPEGLLANGHNGARVPGQKQGSEGGTK